MRILIGILKTITAIFVLLFLTVCVFIFTTPDDIPPFDDSHLIRKIKSIPDNENAYFAYKKAGDLSWEERLNIPKDNSIYDGFFSGTNSIIKDNDVKNAKEWLEKNSNITKLVAKGNAMDSYRSPTLPEYSYNESGFEDASTWLGEVIEIGIRQIRLSKMLGIQSTVYLLEGDIENSYKSIVDNLIFTKKISSNLSRFSIIDGGAFTFFDGPEKNKSTATMASPKSLGF